MHLNSPLLVTQLSENGSQVGLGCDQPRFGAPMPVAQCLHT